MTQQRTADSRTRDTDPAALREVFGDNLRRLCASYPSVSELCRELGINRTQFNRYMSGESFPRPDVLHRICAFFGTDARILLEPVDSLAPKPNDLLNHPFLSEFFGKPTVDVSTDVFPSGFYRFARKSFVDASRFVLGLVMIKRGDGYTFLRGFEPRQGVREQGLSTDPHTREYRGIVMRQEEGIMAVVTHRASLSCSFNFLTPETSFQSNLWEGYASRTVREKVSGNRATRMVYEHLGNSSARILQAARETGVVPIDKVPRFYRHLLRPDEDFR
ncbi:helix-turn-helix transcriptional regulator [Roseovarius sp.]|uniref:helix-turn-helix domain-containing protein n=1 Tax=Roseovarius sp. TaxID=1486281 RepID=UPI0026147E9E|nr:helix-turn-helix transcriptional regulator [Roseovarius sp.]MDM8168330.1 helix-turn-helix transcriptional regulator [Roseovarius sp.]